MHRGTARQTSAQLRHGGLVPPRSGPPENQPAPGTKPRGGFYDLRWGAFAGKAVSQPGVNRSPGPFQSPPTSAHGELVEPLSTVLRQAQDERVFNFHNFEKALTAHASPMIAGYSSGTSATRRSFWTVTRNAFMRNSGRLAQVPSPFSYCHPCPSQTKSSSPSSSISPP